jgi:hypothetical protein
MKLIKMSSIIISELKEFKNIKRRTFFEKKVRFDCIYKLVFYEDKFEKEQRNGTWKIDNLRFKKRCEDLEVLLIPLLLKKNNNKK